METLIQSQCWTRIWIVQELVLAREVMLLAGASRVPLHWVADLLSIMAHHDSNASHICQLLYSQRHEPRTHHFEQILEYLRALGCTLPQDRIFALRGILKSDEVSLL